MDKEIPKPFDLILALAQAANTPLARDLFSDIRDEIEDGGDIDPWVNAIQLARDLGTITRDQAHFLVDRLVEAAVSAVTASDLVLVDLGNQLTAVERAHGLAEDEAFMTNDAPAEWSALNRLWDRRFQDLQLQLLRRVGEVEMAGELVLRPDDMEARSHAGWSELLDCVDEDQ